MSECVVRMTLPKACVWRDDKGNIKMCPLYWEDEARCQGKDGKEAPWYDGKRPDWCPIICQLPDGHGRLIDADAAYKAACEGADNWDGGCSPYRDDCIREEMDKVPTASPWHRVEEPPKYGQNVLTMDADEDMETATYDGEGFEDSYGFYVANVLY